MATKKETGGNPPQATQEPVNIAICRNLKDITNDVLCCKEQFGVKVYEMGTYLNEAKAQLGHGDWLAWLRDKVNISERDAQKFMRIAEKYSNPKAVSDLGITKADMLLALPSDEREPLMTEDFEIKGLSKNVYTMSTRDLKDVINSRKKTQKEETTPVETASADTTSKRKSNTNGKKEFHSNFRYVQDCITGMVDYINSQRDDSYTYKDLSSVLRTLCDDTLKLLSLDEAKDS